MKDLVKKGELWRHEWSPYLMIVTNIRKNSAYFKVFGAKTKSDGMWRDGAVFRAELTGNMWKKVGYLDIESKMGKILFLNSKSNVIS